MFEQYINEFTVKTKSNYITERMYASKVDYLIDINETNGIFFWQL